MTRKATVAGQTDKRDAAVPFYQRGDIALAPAIKRAVYRDAERVIPCADGPAPVVVHLHAVPSHIEV